MSTSTPDGMWVASASSGMVLCVDVDQGVGLGLADDDERDVDGDLLTATDDDQVGVLDEALDRVALHLLGERELAVAVELDRQQRVGGLEREHQVVAGQRDVHRVGAVAVQHGGHLARRAGSGGRRPCRTRCGTRLDLDLG